MALQLVVNDGTNTYVHEHLPSVIMNSSFTLDQIFFSYLNFLKRL